MTKQKTKRVATKPKTAMLVIGNKESFVEAMAAIIGVLSIPAHEPETYQEAMRTLAVIGKPPQSVTVSDCTFTA